MLQFKLMEQIIAYIMRRVDIVGGRERERETFVRNSQYQIQNQRNQQGQQYGPELYKSLLVTSRVWSLMHLALK